MLIYKYILSPALCYDQRWIKKEKMRKKSMKAPLKADDMKAEGSERLLDTSYQCSGFDQ